MKLHGYLTVPRGVEAKNLPVVMYIHGGPWARDYWGYEPYAQFLANRGYAVMQVNYRGSSGYGKAYLNAGNQEWGIGAMQHDITDAVKWLDRRRASPIPRASASSAAATAATRPWPASPSRPTSTPAAFPTWVRRTC